MLKDKILKNKDKTRKTILKPKKIILDTNFLLIPGLQKVDIFAEIDKMADFGYEIVILDGTLRELNNIIEKERRKFRDAAKLAKSLIKAKDLKTVHSTSKKSVDDIIVDLAGRDKHLIIATQDKELKKRLSGNRLIILKQGNYLTFI